MRFFEIAEPQKRVVATKRFLKSAREWIRLYPDVGQTLAEFLRFRETAPLTQGFSKKDAPLMNNLKGFRHVHFRFGKVICVYALAPNEIRLIDIVDHDTMDSDSFHRFVRSVGESDYQQFGGGVEPQQADLSQDAKDDLRDMFYAFAGHPEDRGMLDQTLKGQYVPEFWEMLRSVVPGDAPDSAKNDVVVTAYGGLKGFQAAIQAVLSQTG
ncbi:MAG: hypothetical protein EOP83_20410 [Verrucomicrobiaceae bacterium]|nr:MAG: hypothetical protein EOP83_20410 [Verrucomicrobiaceae bacterium]